MDRGRVLVVDDEGGVREGLRRILDRRQYRVETAASADEALVLLDRTPFDVVLTDLQMPGMDGLELLAAIKGRSPQTSVIMITAHGTMDVVIQALRGGVSDFITKPFRPEELLEILERELARRRPAEAPPPALGLRLSAQQIDEVDHLLAEMRAEIAARCILLIEGSGHLIAAKGSIKDLNVAALASLVAGDFAAASSIASLIGEGESFRMNYHEGERYSVYSAHVAPSVFLLIVFGQELKLGSVLYYARNTIPLLQQILAASPVTPDVAPASAPAPAAPPPADTAAEPLPVFSLDEIAKSGLLGEDVLAALDAQFARLWVAGESNGTAGQLAAEGAE